MIAFGCPSCGMKLQVREEFAGRTGPCPTCKQPITVPQPSAPAAVPTGHITGTPSSLHQAGLDDGVTIDSPRGAAGSDEHSAVADLLAGRVRTGSRYVIEKEIARGGMGAVVRAVDCDIRREVAVKYMLTDGDQAQKARFVEEAQITGQLEHPNIVPIHELGVDGERRLFFAMKMVKGRSLAQVLDELRKNGVKAEQTWSLSRLLTIMTNVCYALSYAHSRGVIHRDLKPANIMLGDFGETYVMDWGLAKVVGVKEPIVAESSAAPSSSGFAVKTKRGSGAATVVPSAPPAGDTSGSNSPKVSTSRELEGELTQDGAILGTPSYMAPEQARGEVQALDNRSDIYSLGAILYEMLTLVSPVEKAGGAMALLMRVAQGEIKPPELRTPDRAKAGKIPKELAAIAMKALALKPEQRYQSVEGLRRDVERFQEGRSVSAKHDTPWETAVKFVKRNRAFSAATGIGVVTLATVLAIAFNVNIAARVRAEEALVLADQNFVAFEAEQKAKNEAITNSIPGTLRAARQLANDGAVDDALKQIALVRTYQPTNLQAALLRGQILTAQRNWPEAAKELAFYRRYTPNDPDAFTLFKLVVTGKTDDLVLLYQAADVLRRQHLFQLTPLLLADAAQLREARKPLVELYNKQVQAAYPGRRANLLDNGLIEVNLYLSQVKINLKPLAGMQIDVLNIEDWHQLDDLEPLRGMPLQRLSMAECFEITDLGPLQGMPLKRLNMQSCSKVSDLEPLRGAPLEELICNSTAVTDFGPLAGMPLKKLHASACDVVDLSPLAGTPLEDLFLDSRGIRSVEPLRGLPLGRLTLSECMELTDLEPLRGIGLEYLSLFRNSKVASLEPLRGAPLKELDLYHCDSLTTLEPLRGTPCKKLNISDCGKITDLSPLRGMPLEVLNIWYSGVRDLSPLTDVRLIELTYDPRVVGTGIEVLRNHPTLKRIVLQSNVTLPVAEFWKRYDAGEYRATPK